MLSVASLPRGTRQAAGNVYSYPRRAACAGLDAEQTEATRKFLADTLSYLPQGPAADGLPTADADHAEQRQEHHQVITASERAPTVVAYTPLQEGAGRGRII